jgi:hypothetical protein
LWAFLKQFMKGLLASQLVSRAAEGRVEPANVPMATMVATASRAMREVMIPVPL